MKVIKQGVDKKALSKEITSTNCRTVIEVTRGECEFVPVTGISYDQRERGYWRYKGPCPVCSRTGTYNMMDGDWD